MKDVAWTIEHSVETTATLEFSWMYMTDVKNWDDPPAEFKLHGPFASGSPGTTEMPGQPPRQWRLKDVKAGESYTIEIALAGAVISCKWVFSGLPDSRTQFTQQITLEGENAASYTEDVRRAFAPGLAPGMSRIAAGISEAYARVQTNRGQR
ncbi:MAG TPA: hypothetical protein VK574_05675 [Terracidiphilus sp.]|nr:hypothetical protein [Terracidiphilus sp.]